VALCGGKHISILKIDILRRQVMCAWAEKISIICSIVTMLVMLEMGIIYWQMRRMEKVLHKIRLDKLLAECAHQEEEWKKRLQERFVNEFR